MPTLVEYADQMWTEGPTSDRHPWRALNTFEEVSNGVWFASSFANLSLIHGGTELLVVDPGATNNAERKFDQIRGIFPNLPVKAVVFTHGHHDHCFGAERYINEANENGWNRPEILAHPAINQRFDRYTKTAGFNEVINSRQFRGGASVGSWKKDYVRPTREISDPTELDVGSVTVQINPARGETDDALWLHIPDLETICTGDLFVWTAPNAGNPQKVQRYSGDWANSLLHMNELNARIILPGHGPPIIGKERVRDALVSTAEYLQTLEDQTIQLMNSGVPLDTILSEVTVPETLLQKHFLQPVYDEPEFIIRNIWRLYGGWYDGQPANLKPPSEASMAVELVRLIPNGKEALMERAVELAAQEEWRLACKLADIAFNSDPTDKETMLRRGMLYSERAKVETSTMTVGIFNSTAREMGILPDSDNTFSAQEK